MTDSNPMTQPTDHRLLPGSGEADDSISTAAIYARTSKSKRGYHYSIDEQVAACWKRCQIQGWEVGFVFTDEAMSGKNTDRLEFQRMIELAESGAFDVVVFWKLDRFSRSITDLVKTEERLNECDVALQSVTEYIDTASPVGRFNFRNLASAAELETDLTSQRVKIGFHGMAKEHRWPNDEPPLGYDLAEDRTLKINEQEAELVRRIFELYLDERSMPRVAHILNQENVTTKNGNEWGRWAVKQVLSNELYKGVYRMGDYEEVVDDYRILSDGLFSAVTETRHRFKHEKGRMDEDRKQSKGDRILDRYKQNRDQSS